MLNPQEVTTRPPVPGEVWRFDYLEVHCFFTALEAMRAFADEDDPYFTKWIATFKPIEDEYRLKEVRGDDPIGVNVTPLDEDVSLFTMLTASQRWHLYALPENALVCASHDVGCSMDKSECSPKEEDFELPCGHLPIEHDTVLRGWADRELTEARKYANTRRALQELPPEERIFGKQKIARSDLERLVDEKIESERQRVLQSDGRFFSPPGTGGFDDQQLLEELIDPDVMGEHVYTEEQARDKISRMNESILRDKREQLIEYYESNMDVIEG